MTMLKTGRTKLPNRKYRPDNLRLEDRCTPTIGTMGVIALSPGIGGPGHLSIAGLIGESDATAAATLQVSYEVTDSQGHELAHGQLPVKPVLPELNVEGVSTTIPISLPAGSTETITLIATDVDSSMVAPSVATAHLYVSPNPHVNTVGVGITASDGSMYAGSGMGHISVKMVPGVGIFAAGAGSFQIASVQAPVDPAINASASGAFHFSLTSYGRLTLNAQGQATFNEGTFAGDAMATQGVSVHAKAGISVVAQAGAFISVHAHGALGLQLYDHTTNPTHTLMITGGATASIGFYADTTGHFKLQTAGNIRLFGYYR